MENNNLPPLTGKVYLLQLKSIAIGLVVAQLIFPLVTIYLSFGRLGEINWNTFYVFLILVPVVTIGGIVGGFSLFNLKLKEANAAVSIDNKLTCYVTAVIMRLALLEMASLIATVAFLISGAIYFLVVPIIITIVMYSFFPNKNRVVQDLQLTLKEEEFFDS